MSDGLLPTGRALLRRADLGAGPWDGAPDVLALAPVLGWLLEAVAPAHVVVVGTATHALVVRLAEDRTVVTPEGSIVEGVTADAVVVGPDADAAVDAAAVAAVAAGSIRVAVVPGASGPLPAGVVAVPLAIGAGVRLVGAAADGPVAGVLADPRLDDGRRLLARLAAALVAEDAATSAASARDVLAAERTAALRDLGRAEEEADRARTEAARLRVRLAAVEGLRGELVHAYDRLDRVLSSASWRLTAPVRSVLRALPPVRRVLRATVRGVVRVASPRAWRAARSRRDRYGHADTAVALAEAAAARPVGALRREKDPDHVGWVASVGDPFTTRYRVSNLAVALGDRGFRGTVVPSDGFDAARLEDCGTVVLCRVAWDDTVAAEVARLRESGTRIVFDVDDLVFDPSRVGLTSPGPNQVAPRRHLFGRYRTTLLEADAVTVSTAPLRDEVAALGRPVAVVPNNLGRDVLERWSDPTVARARRDARDGADGTVRIAYLSGTATHVQDVREMARALAGVLRARPEVELHVVGPVELPPELDGLRVVRHPLQRYHDLFGLLATMDVNLAPLELENEFTAGKSELKVFEAALLGVPTIASPTRPYAAAIDHGRTGLLAATGEEWSAALTEVVGDAGLRAGLGSAARTHIAPRFAVDAVAAVSARVLGTVGRTDALDVLPVDLGAVRGDLALILPVGEDAADLQDLVRGLVLDPMAGRVALLLPEGDPNLPVVRRTVDALAHGARPGGLPAVVGLPVAVTAPPAALAAAALAATGATGLGVVPAGAAVATGGVAAALGALAAFHPEVVVGLRSDDGGVVAPLRRLGLDADLGRRPAPTVVTDAGALAGLAPFLPVLGRDWAAARPAVLAALLAGEDVGRVLGGVLAAGATLTLVPGLRGSVRPPAA